MKRCGICGRRMLPHRLFWLYGHIGLAGRLDCGGDCFRCIDETRQS